MIHGHSTISLNGTERRMEVGHFEFSSTSAAAVAFVQN